MTKRPPIYEVHWEDIATTHGWRFYPAKCTTANIVTVGYMTVKTKKYVHMTQSLCTDDECTDETTVIPRGVIHKMRRLR